MVGSSSLNSSLNARDIPERKPAKAKWLKHS